MVMKATATPGAFEDTAVEAASAASPIEQAAAQAAAAPAAEVGGVSGNAAAPAAPAPQLPAVQKNTAVVVADKEKSKTALVAFENALEPVDFGVLERLTGSAGVIMDSDKQSLGTSIDVELISFNKEFVVTPGTDDPGAKKDVRYSLDGVTLSDGSGLSCAEYLQILQTTKGYTKAAIKEYTQVIAIVKRADKPNKHVDSMVQISLSPQSRLKFTNYRLQNSVKVRLGTVKEEDLKFITFTAEPKTLNGNTFTLLLPSITARAAA